MNVKVIYPRKTMKIIKQIEDAKSEYIERRMEQIRNSTIPMRDWQRVLHEDPQLRVFQETINKVYDLSIPQGVEIIN